MAPVLVPASGSGRRAAADRYSSEGSCQAPPRAPADQDVVPAPKDAAAGQASSSAQTWGPAGPAPGTPTGTCGASWPCRRNAFKCDQKRSAQLASALSDAGSAPTLSAAPPCKPGLPGCHTSP